MLDPWLGGYGERYPSCIPWNLGKIPTVEASIRGHFPEEYGIESALWTRKAVRALIDQLCEVKMPIRTVGEYLRRWGYSPQKPLQRAYEQDPKAVKQTMVKRDVSRYPATSCERGSGDSMGR